MTCLRRHSLISRSYYQLWKILGRAGRAVDPPGSDMGFFEEITRFKLIKGILPLEALYLPEQLDVLVAAYTAWQATQHPGEVIAVGDREEGQIILPVKSLREKY